MRVYFVEVQQEAKFSIDLLKFGLVFDDVSSRFLGVNNFQATWEFFYFLDIFDQSVGSFSASLGIESENFVHKTRFTFLLSQLGLVIVYFRLIDT